MGTSKKIRDLMPVRFLPILSDRTGCASDPTLSNVVNRERSGSKYWAAILTLAEETDPEGYAQWAAANPDKLPAAGSYETAINPATGKTHRVFIPTKESALAPAA